MRSSGCGRHPEGPGSGRVHRAEGRGTRDNNDIITKVVQMVRNRIGPVASFKTETVLKRLPKTRSGKILRGTIQKLADNKEFKMPATIDAPLTLTEMEEALVSIGYAKARK
jgi:propionyl-CoA synthetase